MKDFLTNIADTIRVSLSRLHRRLSGQRAYDIFVAEYLRSSYEDPRCPSYWHGSGCYDIEVYATRFHRWTVTATCEQQAEKVYSDYLASLGRSPYDDETRVLGVMRNTDCDPLDFAPGEMVGSDQTPVHDDDLEWSNDDSDVDLDDAINAFMPQPRIRMRTQPALMRA